MANYLTTTVGVSGNVNGIAINQNGNSTTTPTGSTAFVESTLVNTTSWQLVFTGSSDPIGTIALFSTDTSGTGSISVSTSSNGANPILNVTSPLGAAIATNWNAPLTALYAKAFVTASYGIFVVVAN